MALNYKVIITPSARNNIRDIHDHIEDHLNDPYVADNISRKIVRFVKNMSYNPFIGRVADDEQVRGKGIRRITALDRYNIFFRVDEQAQTIYILKIADGRQSTDRQLFGL